jgi:hypothetical protein
VTDEHIPQGLKVSAMVQVVSGVINLALTSWMSWLGVSCLCGTLTLPFLSVGGFCGFASLLLIPLGLLEIGAGVYGWLNPREAAPVMRGVAALEVSSLLVGAFPSAIAGAFVYSTLKQDDILVYLEG